MRWLYFLLFGLLTTALIIVLSIPLGPAPFPAGQFLNPFTGFWQNGAVRPDDSAEFFQHPDLREEVTLVYDERGVPHIFAQNDFDLTFVQGYVEARDRLWQIDLISRVSAGRLSEVFGAGPDSSIFRADRSTRRLGLPWAAARSLDSVRKDSLVWMALVGYAAGINAYIEELEPQDYPFEYKLLNYEPEAWEPLKTLLVLKYMSRILTSYSTDLEYTHARRAFGGEYLDLLYPVRAYADSAPIVPSPRRWPFEALPLPLPPEVYAPDSLLMSMGPGRISEGRDPVGSNNWAVHGSRTATGRPMLAGDPHLTLNLPSIWYEIHLRQPDYNVYGVSLPGTPGVIIGYNDSIAWSATNSSRDVLDHYRVTYRDASQMEYRYGDDWEAATIRVDTYRVKGFDAPFLDSVRLTRYGPVMYDAEFGETSVPIAVRWTAHDASNEARAVLILNRARNFEDYREAMRYYNTPGQNFVFASASGDIALQQQGKFPLRWRGQGRYLLDAADTAHAWAGFIPFEHNPVVRNPARGYVYSANQVPTEADYPYPYQGHFEAYRNRRIAHLLAADDSVTLADMQAFQQDNFNLYAADLLPTLLAEIDSISLNRRERRQFDRLKRWNYYNDADKVEPSLFDLWYDILELSIWGDEFEVAKGELVYPDKSAFIGLLRDSARFRFYDNINTPERETRRMLVNRSFRKMVDSLYEISGEEESWRWYRFKNTQIKHMVPSLTVLGRDSIKIGGGRNILNATTSRWGPSWRMVVLLGDEPEGYGVYPGGQDGNPASPNYDRFIDDWAAGKYYRLHRPDSPDELQEATHRRVFKPTSEE